MSRILLAVLIVSWSAERVAAQPGPTDADFTKELQQLFSDVASGYNVDAQFDGEMLPLQMRDEPIMHWTSRDGTNGEHVGSVFVWTHKQRPEVIGTIFTWRATRDNIPSLEEFCTFSWERLLVRSQQGDTWEPEPLKMMRPIPDAPAPASSERARRLQIRSLARNFSGRMHSIGEPHPLRLLPTPVYQYECEDSNVSTGAVFAMVAFVTDPDIFFLIEARTTADGPKWFYQPVRFSDKSLWLDYKNKNVWKSVRAGHGSNGPDTPDPQYRLMRYSEHELPAVE